jgi:hypothetical protein
MVDEDDRPIWTVEKQRKYIHDATTSAELPKGFKSVPQVLTDSPESRLMYHLMFSDYVDVTFDQAPRFACRVLTPSNPARQVSSQPIPTNLPAASALGMASAWQAIESEMLLTLINPPHPDDISVCVAFTPLEGSSPGRANDSTSLAI